ncbi:MAG: hypothetical protein ACLUVB_00280 [Acutalibacteraceae bacterium]
MAFLPQSYRDGQPEPWEYLEAAAIGACTVGMALTLTSGKLASAPAQRGRTISACTAARWLPGT